MHDAADKRKFKDAEYQQQREKQAEMQLFKPQRFGPFTDGATGLRRQVTQLFDAIAVVNGDLTTYGIKTPWADDGLAVSLGTEYRKDRLISTADAGFVQQFGNQDARLSQDVWESNIELQAPLIQNKPFAHLLQTNGGFRVSKYSSNPKTFSTWKIEGLYAPVSDLTFRASYNKAQRAPTVIEIRQATQINFGRNTKLTDFCAPVPRTQADGTVTTAPTSPRRHHRAVRSAFFCLCITNDLA